MSIQDHLAEVLNRRPVHEHFDTAETVHITGIALLKMLQHTKAGIPNDVIGILLGKFVDDYTVSVVDVFPTPQTGAGTSIDTFEENFQERMLGFLKSTGRKEEIVGWYHSHPGLGVWLSGVALHQQMHWEKVNHRCIAVVLDPVQSVRGKVVIGAFRCIDTIAFQQGDEPRETTSFIGHLEKPTTKALVRGLNRQYYQMPVVYRMSKCEQQMLMSINKPIWFTEFHPESFQVHDKNNDEKIEELIENASAYRRNILTEEGMSPNEYLIRSVGKVDAMNSIKQKTDEITADDITQLMRVYISSLCFQIKEEDSDPPFL